MRPNRTLSMIVAVLVIAGMLVATTVVPTVAKIGGNVGHCNSQDWEGGVAVYANDGQTNPVNTMCANEGQNEDPNLQWGNDTWKNIKDMGEQGLGLGVESLKVGVDAGCEIVWALYNNPQLVGLLDFSFLVNNTGSWKTWNIELPAAIDNEAMSLLVDIDC